MKFPFIERIKNATRFAKSDRESKDSEHKSFGELCIEFSKEKGNIIAKRML